VASVTWDQFKVGLATLERYYHRSLHPADRDAYFSALKNAGEHRWEKCVQYAMNMSKAFPRISELREWMGLPEPLAPLEDEEGFRPGTIHGLTPAQICAMAREGRDLPFPEPWKDKVEEMCYLDQPYKDPAPKELTPEERLAWIRKYAEAAAAEYEQVKPS